MWQWGANVTKLLRISLPVAHNRWLRSFLIIHISGFLTFVFLTEWVSGSWARLTPSNPTTCTSLFVADLLTLSLARLSQHGRHSISSAMLTKTWGFDCLCLPMSILHRLSACLGVQPCFCACAAHLSEQAGLWSGPLKVEQGSGPVLDWLGCSFSQGIGLNCSVVGFFFNPSNSLKHLHPCNFLSF